MALETKLTRHFWLDDDVWDLPHEMKLCFAYLISGGHTNNAGVVRFSRRVFMNETRMSWSVLEETIKRLPRAIVGGCSEKGAELFLVNFLKWQLAPGQRSSINPITKGLLNLWLDLPAQFREVFDRTYPDTISVFRSLTGSVVTTKRPEATSTAQHSTAQISSSFPEGGAGETGGGQVVAEADVQEFAAGWAGDLSRGIPPGIPEAFWREWFAWRSDVRPGRPWPVDWQADLVRRFKAAWVNGEPTTRGGSAGSQKKGGAVSGGVLAVSLRASIEALAARLVNHPGDPTKYDMATDGQRAEFQALRRRLREQRQELAALLPVDNGGAA